MACWNPAATTAQPNGAAALLFRRQEAYVRLVPMAAIMDLLAAETQPRRAALIAATSISFIVIIASNARFASSPPAAFASA
jgi:hypothetical protein